MALAKQCDRCKRYYKHYDTTDCKFPRQNGIMTVMISQKGGCQIGDSNTFDLCPDCFVSFADWFALKGETEHA